MTRKLTIYVPASEDTLGIKPGSAIVGDGEGRAKQRPRVDADSPTNELWIDIYFEGNLYGAANITSFEDMLRHAADRLVDHYPTAARRRVPAKDLHAVGWWHYPDDPPAITDPDRLAAWRRLAGAA